MYQSNLLAFSSWARRHRTLFAVLLGLTVLFNAAQVFAAMAMKPASQAHAVTAGHVHEMQSPCCPLHSSNDTHCCLGVDCACTAHCTSLWLSQQFPVLHDSHKAFPQFQAENTPASYILPPPQQPPRL